MCVYAAICIYAASRPAVRPAGGRRAGGRAAGGGALRSPGCKAPGHKAQHAFFFNNTPAASLKRSKHGLGTPKYAFSKKACFSRERKACGSERLVNMGWVYQNI